MDIPVSRRFIDGMLDIPVPRRFIVDVMLQSATQMSTPTHHADSAAPTHHSGLSPPAQHTGVSAASHGGDIKRSERHTLDGLFLTATVQYGDLPLSLRFCGVVSRTDFCCLDSDDSSHCRHACRHSLQHQGREDEHGSPVVFFRHTVVGGHATVTVRSHELMDGLFNNVSLALADMLKNLHPCCMKERLTAYRDADSDPPVS